MEPSALSTKRTPLERQLRNGTLNYGPKWLFTSSQRQSEVNENTASQRKGKVA